MKGISREDFDKFTEEMWVRLKKGEKKYGTKFIKANIEKEILEEAVDLSNYSFLLFLLTKKFIKGNNANMQKM